MYKIIPNLLYEGTQSASSEEPQLPKDTTYSADMPTPARYADLRCLGMNAKQRQRVRTFERLSHLTGLAEMTEPGSDRAEHTLAKQLSVMVLSGGNAKDIVSAREQIARLHLIAKDLHDQVHHLMTHPEGSYTYLIKDEEKPHFEKCRNDLFALCGELSARAGEPEPMKTKAAEKMRQKLEVKLLPKLNAEIPKWAERLRFLHSEVLKWTKPAELYEEPEQLEDADPEAEEEDIEWEAPPEYNPKPKGEELELLKAMGWGAEGAPPQ